MPPVKRSGDLEDGWEIKKIYEEYVSKLAATVEGLYVNTEEGSLFRISKKASNNRIEIATSVHFVSMTSDGTSLYGVDMSGDLKYITPKEHPQQAIQKTISKRIRSPRGIHFANNSLFVSADHQILQFDSDGSNQKPLCSNVAADAICADSSSVVYLTTHSSFIYKIQNQLMSIVCGDAVAGLKDGSFHEASFTCPNPILATRRGLVFVGNRKRLRCIDLNKKIVQTVWKSNGEILCFSEDPSSDDIFIGTSDGVFCLTPPPPNPLPAELAVAYPEGTKLKALKQYKTDGGLFKSNRQVKFLSFKEGELVTVTKDRQNGWILVKTKEEEGFVPGYCFQPVEPVTAHNDSGLLNKIPLFLPLTSRKNEEDPKITLSPKKHEDSPSLTKKNADETSSKSQTEDKSSQGSIPSSPISSKSTSPSNSQPSSNANSEVFYQANGNGSFGIASQIISSSMEHMNRLIEAQEKQIKELKDENELLRQRPTKEAFQDIQDQLQAKERQIQDLKAKITELEDKLQSTQPPECKEISFEDLTDKSQIKASGTAHLSKAKYGETWVAVKQFFLQEESGRKTLWKELQHLCVCHQNIVSLKAKVLEPLCVVTEYVEQGSLSDLLYNKKSAAIPVQLKVHLMKQVAAGLQFLHQHNIVHGNLKPSNVLITESWVVKLSDFGMTKIEELVENNNSKQYSAPEALGENQITEKGDIYSFGILLWEVLAEKKPYEGLKGYPLMKKISEERTKPELKEISNHAQFAEVCQACWADKPEDRPSAAEVVTRLYN